MSQWHFATLNESLTICSTEMSWHWSVILLYYKETEWQHGVGEWGQRRELSKTLFKLSHLRININVKAQTNKKLRLLLVFKLTSLIGPVWVSTSIFDKYLQMKKEEIIYMNLKAHVLLLFSICYVLIIPKYDLSIPFMHFPLKIISWKTW